MGRRTKARECAFQILYQREITGEEIAKVVDSFWMVRSGTAHMRAMAERLAFGATGRAAQLDEAIVGAAANWRLDRMAPVDRTILRLGAYELLAEEETPAAVVLDEAIELAKRFGEADSPAFVNGVLDAICRQVRPPSGRPRKTRARGENEG
jgi:transcription antitermination protein NusB